MESRGVPVLKVYIPSAKRSNKLLTYRKLPPTVQKHTFIVVPNADVNDYEAAIKGTPGHVLACPEKGIVRTRDWIIEEAHKSGHRRIVQLDDDLDLQRRREDMRITNVTTGQEYVEAFEWIEEQLRDGYAHCGWGTRFLAYADSRSYFENSRMMYCLAYDVRKVKLAGAKFSKGLGWDGTMEDFNMTLQMLQAGYKNKVSLEWRASPRGTNAAGGCSTWRSTAGANASARSLEKQYPGLVRVVAKKAWAGMDEGLLDIRAQWKKAFKGE